MKQFLKQTIARWKAKSPEYFRTILKWSIGVFTALVAGYTALTTAGLTIPAWLQAIYPYAVGFSAGLASLSKVTKQQQDDGDKEG